MGVFDSIRDKIGVSEESEGEDDAGGAGSSPDQSGGDQTTQTRSAEGEPADGTADAAAEDDAAAADAATDESEPDEGADESPDPADDLQTHGNHWAALVPPQDRERFVQELLEDAIELGDELEGESRGDTEVGAYQFQHGPAGIVAVSVDDEVVTGYPVADGVEQEVEVEQVGEWDSEVEAWLVGECGPATLTAFATNYYEIDKETVGGPKDAEIAVVMYNVAEAEEEEVELGDGETIDVSDFAGLRPWEQGAPDDCVVRTVVEDVEQVDFGRHQLYRIEAPLIRQDDVEELDGVFYVADHVAGDYEPEPGDAIEGAAWIQAAFR